jgi:protein-arginine deiminase
MKGAAMKSITLYQVVGQRSRFLFNKQRGQIVLINKSGLELFWGSADGWQPFNAGDKVEASWLLNGLLEVSSNQAGHHYAVLQNCLHTGEVIDELRIELFTFKLCLDVDADRDGEVGQEEPGKANWVWGKDQPGAITIVHNDRDISADASVPNLLIRATGVDDIPSEVELVLYATPKAAERFTIYRKHGTRHWEPILGRDRPDDPEQPINVSPPLSHTGECCWLRVHEYPDADFEGLLTVELHIQINEQIFGTDQVVFRVAPWIMTPNTLQAKKVYACRTTSTAPNSKFLEQLQGVCEKLGTPLEVLPESENNSDRWIQDEVEFGYCQDVKRIQPVLCDSPRRAPLDGIAERLFRPEFSYFKCGGSNTPTPLDSFGNLDVSPPVEVNGRMYPLGRIIFGGRAYGNYGAQTREMMPEIRRFLYAQKVQSPIEIFTDWLQVGHVDEILNFVPANTAKGFKLLLASPRTAQALLQALREQGYGQVRLLEGKKRNIQNNSSSAEITVDELLDNSAFWNANRYFQQCMDQNREILKRELRLDEADIVDLPLLFCDPATDQADRTTAYFPNIVNQLVIGKTSIVPKPYGPIIDGECIFEKAIRESLRALDRDYEVCFIDDWYSYYVLDGDIHCGTNVYREPFPDARWWEYKPDGGYDV